MKKTITALLCLLFLSPALVRAQCNPQISWAAAPSGNDLLRTSFTNTTSYTTPPGSYAQFTLHYGDGASQPYYNGTTYHNYAAPGTYNALLCMRVLDSITMQTSCSDTLFFQVTAAYTACATTITKQNNGGGSYTFTANTPAGTSSMSYSWNFGDGNTGTGSPVTHTYATTGNYTVSLQATGGGCVYSNTTPVQYNNGSINCDSLHADFLSNASGLNVAFTNTSNYWFNTYQSANWSFGDGSSSTQSSPSHTYTTPGTYAVTLHNTWIDSFLLTQCHDSITHMVIVTGGGNPLNNELSGMIYYDSLLISNPSDSFKIWLIQHDSSANTLTAVDSTYRSIYNPHYAFHNKPSGSYLVKAAVLGQPVSSFGFIPTYHYSSPYWSGATTIYHAGGATLNKDIVMLTGTVTAGPGFIGGNISLGAGKGTGTGAPGMLVLLRNNSNLVIASTYTDADGNYSFGNIPEGTYNVYPEEMNYATTPSATITIGAGHTSSTGNNFKQTDSEIVPLGGLSIAGLSKEDGISVYPNPVGQVMFIESKNNKLNQATLVNVLGQVVKQQALKPGSNKIETADLGSGIYYLIIKGDGGARSLKISKK